MISRACPETGPSLYLHLSMYRRSSFGTCACYHLSASVLYVLGQVHATYKIFMSISLYLCTVGSVFYVFWQVHTRLYIRMSIHRYIIICMYSRASILHFGTLVFASFCLCTLRFGTVHNKCIHLHKEVYISIYSWARILRFGTGAY